MNANVPIKNTQAETDLIARFDAAKTDLPGSVAVAALREAAIAQTRDKGLPHRRVEEYKYSDLRAFMKSAAPLVAAAESDAVKAALDVADTFGDLDRYRIVVANGNFHADLSDTDALAGEGLSVVNLADVLPGEGGAQALSYPKTGPLDGVVALNTAFVQGGVVITVKEGTDVSKPVELIQISTSEGGQVVRNKIAVGKGSKLRLLETFVGNNWRWRDQHGVRLSGR